MFYDFFQYLYFIMLMILQLYPYKSKLLYLSCNTVFIFSILISFQLNPFRIVIIFWNLFYYHICLFSSQAFYKCFLYECIGYTVFSDQNNQSQQFNFQNNATKVETTTTTSTPSPSPEEDEPPPPPIAARPEKTKSIVSSKLMRKS